MKQEKLIKRTNMCGDLRITDVGKEVRLNGWVQRRRNLGTLIFVDLRDKTGITQIVFDEKTPADVALKADSLRSEYTIGVVGKVRERESKNPDLPTGAIEVEASDLLIYSKAETPPIYIKDDDNVDENLRLKYRFLDLRKPHMQRNLAFRSKVTTLARNFFAEEGFTEVETPMLIKPTPEGARDYLVPSRVNPGKFYALPQSPQLFKQLLMVGGTDRYFQIAKCFRDEDLRADRQPEFTQIDFEMSFVDEDDVLSVQERFLKRLFKELKGVDIEIPLRRMPWVEAMERFGSDKPDLRFGFELKKLNDALKGCDFAVFRDVIEAGGDVRGVNINGYSDKFSRKDIDKMTDHIKKSFGAKGLAWIRVEEGGAVNSPIAKFFTEDQMAKILAVFDAKPNDLILIVSDKVPQIVFNSLGFLRRDLAGKLGLLDPNRFELLWVVEFPLFEKDLETGELSAMHHPFTCPVLDDVPLLDTDPLKVMSRTYDIVLNGVEMGGGGIRIHDSELQAKMFQVLGISDEDAQRKFGFLLEAFRYGAPPHGGMAYGLDRMVMLLLGEESIREVIAFPKNQAAQCLMSDAPSFADASALQELHITTVEE